MLLMVLAVALVGCTPMYANVVGSGEVGIRLQTGQKVRGQGCVVAEVGDRTLDTTVVMPRWYVRLMCAGGQTLERGDVTLAGRCPVMPLDAACSILPATP